MIIYIYTHSSNEFMSRDPSLEKIYDIISLVLFQATNINIKYRWWVGVHIWNKMN